MASENLNAAFHQLGYNGHGGFTNQSTKLKKTRSNRVFNNQAITRKRNNFKKQQIVAKKMNDNASRQKEIKAVIERMKAIEAEETYYAKVRDPGFGFIIVNKKANTKLKNKNNKNSK
jgi:hypothetical protein